MSLTAALLAALAQQGADAPVTPTESPAIAFSIRADPSIATEVNRVLREVAAPTVTALPAGEDAVAYLAGQCAGLAAPDLLSLRTRPGASQSLARHTPCLRVARNRRVPVREGNTLYSMAVRNGLSAEWINRFKVVRGNSASNSNPADLHVGDIVTIPQVPLWTDLVARRDRVASWGALIAFFAQAFDCQDQAEAEACLVRRGITLLPRGSYKPLGAARPGPGRDSSRPHMLRAPNSGGFGLRSAALILSRALFSVTTSGAAVAGPAGTTSAMGAFALIDTLAPAGTAPPAPAAALPQSPQPLGVAAGQWPYDPELLSLLIQDSRSRIRTGFHVGVADGGLASQAGGPLPADLFDPAAGEETEVTPEPDGNDDDDNSYVDDLLGAGVVREASVVSLAKGDGDLRLCSNPVAFGDWTGLPREKASHGSVVASLAGGLAFRQRFPDLKPFLPKVIFFRLLPNECEPSSQFEPAPGEIKEALEYLFEKTDTNIVNLSYKIAEPHRTLFQTTVRSAIDGEDRLLVVSAGNDNNNVFANMMCPPCLAHPDIPDNHNVAVRTIVVGAATQQLGIAPGSNYGDRVVSLYAPGQPLGAVDIVGGDASGWTPATSYAAPQVAFAAALLQALGLNKYYEIKERLRQSTWPLQDNRGWVSEPVGVLDLVRVAAVYRDVVEVTEVERGIPVRKTYVGRILEPIENLSLCSPAFSRSRWHSLRLMPPDSEGNRIIRASPRRINDETDRYESQNFPCTPGGSLTLRSLRPGEGDLMFPLSRVNHLLLAWRNP